MSFFFKFFIFDNQWKSAAWRFQDRMSVVWAFFLKFFFCATNGKVQLDCYKIGYRSCELLFSSFFFNQWKSAAWWLQDRVSVVWASFFKFFFCNQECRSCELLFIFYFFATNGQVQLDGYKIEFRWCELHFSFLFFCNQWTSASWWLQDRMSVVWTSFFMFFLLQPLEKCSLMVTR